MSAYDEQMTLDDHGIPFTLQELIDLRELREGVEDEKSKDGEI